jgi:hypothetical protein
MSVSFLPVLISALAANDFVFLTVANGHVVPKVGPEGDVVAAVKTELFPLQHSFQYVTQQFGFVVACFSSLVMGASKIKKAPPPGDDRAP